MKNTLYYGDNLSVLRDYIPTESVDLIYLDPPFNSNRSYNVLFKDESGKEAESQITAFDDSWHWGELPDQTSTTDFVNFYRMTMKDHGYNPLFDMEDPNGIYLLKFKNNKETIAILFWTQNQDVMASVLVFRY